MRLLSLLALLVAVLLSGCEQPKEPVKIGFIGGTSGRIADLGIAGRDAVILAVEEVNQQGGLHGRPVELIVRDDGQDSARVKTAVRELVDAQVSAIIGPMTSQMAVEAVPLINKARVVAISPTAKTDQLSGRDDYFFRVTPELGENARTLSRHLIEERQVDRLLVVYDTRNRAFTETWLKTFSAAYETNGGVIVAGFPFESGGDVSFLDLASRVAAADARGLLILASALDTAMFSQQLTKLKSSLSIFTSEWSFTRDLISFGGHSVEGLSSYHSFNAGSSRMDYLQFQARFMKRFGYEPSFATTLAYDASRVLLAALEKFPEQGDLKEGLLRIGRYQGLQSEIHFNRFGDVQRELFLTTIEDGRFVVGN